MKRTKRNFNTWFANLNNTLNQNGMSPITKHSDEEFSEEFEQIENFFFDEDENIDEALEFVRFIRDPSNEATDDQLKQWETELFGEPLPDWTR